MEYLARKEKLFDEATAIEIDDVEITKAELMKFLGELK
jgi:hypothetical protein